MGPAQILEQSSGTKSVCVSVCILFWSLYKTNRFHFAAGLFSNRSQRTSKCGKTSVTHSPVALVPPRCFDHILTSSVIYYWTDARQHGIYALNGGILQAASSGFPKAQWGARNKREAREQETSEKRLRRIMVTNIPRKLIAIDRGRGSIRW